MSAPKGTPPPRWRSLLFVPAHVDKFVAGAAERGADAIILDLEDAVPPECKEAARSTLASSVNRVARSGAVAMVRVNRPIRQLGKDLDAAVVAGLGALVLPKVDSAGFVTWVAEELSDLERERSLIEGSVRLVLQIESPVALPRLPDIAAAHRRTAAMILGPEDYCAALGATPGPEVLLGPNLAVLQSARAAGVLPLGFVGSIADYGDLAAYATRIAEARRLGFRGAMAVHPSQVAVLNDGFAPTLAEIEWARRVIDGDVAARKEGRAAFQIDGKMIDGPIVQRARETIALSGGSGADSRPRN